MSTLDEIIGDYMDHVYAGLSMRAIARAHGCHASTVLRRVQRVEDWRDNPDIDMAIEQVGEGYEAGTGVKVIIAKVEE